MRHLTVVVLASELEVTTRAIAHVGVLHLLDVQRTVEPLATIRPYDMSQQLARLGALAHTLDSVLTFFAITPPEPGIVPEGAALDLQAVEARAAALAEQVQQLRQRLREVTDQGTQVENLLRNVRALAPLGLPLDQLRGLRYVYLTSGLLPERNLPRLHESLARVPHVIVPTGKAGPDGRILVAALCLRQERDVLERAARSAQLEAVELPVHLSGTPEEITAQLQAQLDAQRSARAGLEAHRHENGERVAGECREAAVGGVPVTRRPDRHRLPERQARRSHPVEQRVGGRAEIADAEARRQGRGVQEESRRPRRHARMVDEERRGAV
jgi:vacuolar-type H+-ATPase subunit I/STV1